MLYDFCPLLAADRATTKKLCNIMDLLCYNIQQNDYTITNCIILLYSHQQTFVA